MFSLKRKRIHQDMSSASPQYVSSEYTFGSFAASDRKWSPNPFQLSRRPVWGHSLRPLPPRECVGITNVVAFSWILTSLSPGLPRSLIGAIGLGLGPDRGAEKGRKISERAPSPRDGFGPWPSARKGCLESTQERNKKAWKCGENVLQMSHS